MCKLSQPIFITENSRSPARNYYNAFLCNQASHDIENTKHGATLRSHGRARILCCSWSISEASGPSCCTLRSIQWEKVLDISNFEALSRSGTFHVTLNSASDEPVATFTCAALESSLLWACYKSILMHHRGTTRKLINKAPNFALASI